MALLSALGCLPAAAVAAAPSPDGTGELVVRALSVDEGLAHPHVRAMAETPDGYLWIATDGGLSRFDGATFTTFDGESQPRLPSNLVRSLLVDRRDGALWIGTLNGGGLLRMRDGRLELVPGAGAAGPIDALHLAQDPEGAIWALGWFDVARLRGETAERLAGGDPGASVNSLALAPDGAVWIGSTGMLFRHHGGAVTRTPLPGIDTSAQSMAFEPDGSIWVGTANRGLVRARGGAVEPTPVPRGRVEALLRDPDGTLWIGATHGLFRLREGRLDEPLGRWPHPLVVTALRRDREGSLWVGTRDRGLLQLRPPVFTTIAPPGAAWTDRPLAVLAARDGAIWIGSESGLTVVRDGTIRRLTGADGLCVGYVRALWEDHRGHVWVGGNARGPHHVCRFDGRRFVGYAPPPGVDPSTNVWSIYEDSRRRVWVGGWELSRVEGDTLVPVPGLRPGKNARVIHEDRRGALWVGTGHGLLRLEEGGARYFGRADGLADDLVRSIAETADGTLWFGTLHGLSRLRGGRLEAVGPAAGLFDQPVYAIAADPRGKLWLCTPRGVLRVDVPAPGGRLSYVRYGRADGLGGDECPGEHGASAVARASGGERLFFLAGATVAAVAPLELPSARVPGPVVETLALDERRRAVRITYTAPSLSAAHRLRFRHRLEGLDADWIETGTRRSVEYTNLPPRAYRFTVAVASEDGVWSERPAALAFAIPPAWHETGAARAGLAIALVLAAFGAHRWRLRIVKARYAAVLDERARVARDIHDTIVQDLLAVWMRLEALRRNGRAVPPEVAEPLNALRGSVEAGLDEARRLLAELRTDQRRAPELVSALAEVAHRLADGTGTRVRIETVRPAGGGPPSPDAARALLRIGQEAVANALRHAGAGEIIVEVTLDRTLTRLRVRDDGRGFDTAAPSPGTGGQHFGLVGIRERAESLRGRVEIDSRPGAGTTVTVEIPREGS